MPTGPEIKRDEAFLESQGFLLTLINQDRERATWYKPDGTPLPNLPTDLYHRTRYRNRGWTLIAPATDRQVVILPGEERGGRPTGSVQARPPRHIHVMQPELGSPCLVQGCNHLRQGPSGEFKTQTKETTHAR